MKKGIVIFLIALAIGQAENAMAATVQVYPIITSSHGGTANAADMKSCITANGQTQCDTNVPTFSIPDGSTYSVTITPAAGYSYSLDSNCNGVAQGDIICNATYEDGAPIAQPTPAAVPQPVVQPLQQTAVPAQPAAVPAPTVTTNPVENSSLVVPASTAAPADPTPEPKPQVITQTVIEYVQATSAPIESPTTTQQVQDLTTRVSALEAAVQWLQSVVISIKNFLGL